MISALRNTAALRCDEISLVPEFLGQGSHLQRDLLPMVDELRAAYPALIVTVDTAVGENADVLNATPTDYVLLC